RVRRLFPSKPRDKGPLAPGIGPDIGRGSPEPLLFWRRLRNPTNTTQTRRIPPTKHSEHQQKAEARWYARPDCTKEVLRYLLAFVASFTSISLDRQGSTRKQQLGFRLVKPLWFSTVEYPAHILLNR